MKNWNRKQRAAAGRQTAAIIEARGYQLHADRIELGELLDRAAEATQSYPPERAIPLPTLGEHKTMIEVTNETTLAAARRLSDAGATPLALNFASAKTPGGGFLSGARAQEESLATKSCLYRCLVGNEMYERHRAARDPMYSPSAIYSPDVPVIRDEGGELLSKPWLCAFVTAPAPNAKAVLNRAPGRADEIHAQLELRIERVLAIAADRGHSHLVLGAWGCGVFGNDGDDVASLFRSALEGPFSGVFAEVVFAVLDWSAEQRFIGPFRRRFAA